MALLSNKNCATSRIVSAWDVDASRQAARATIHVRYGELPVSHTPETQLEFHFHLNVGALSDAPLQLSFFASDCLLAVALIAEPGLSVISLSLASMYVGAEIYFDVVASSWPTNKASSHEALRNFCGSLEVLGVFVSQSVIALAPTQALITFGRQCSEMIMAPDLHKTPWSNADQLEQTIARHITSREPFSFVRCGDGEGRLLGFPGYFSEFTMLREVIGYQFGPSAVDKLRNVYEANRMNAILNDLRGILLPSLSSANVIGIPSPIHFAVEAKHDNVSGLLGLASAASFFYLHNNFLSNKELLVDTFVARALLVNGGIARIVRNEVFLGIICNSSIKVEMQARWKIPEIAEYLIPPHYTTIGTNDVHYPDAFWRICDNIDVPFQGAVFLVGAGILGKVYCEVIKQRGGIALDIGAVFDAWSGHGHRDMGGGRHQMLHA